MSKLVEYVGFFHILKERVREAWTQFWSESSGFVGTVSENSALNQGMRVNINFRQRVCEKLQRLRKTTIERIDHSSNSFKQTDFSHVFRKKTQGELLKISAAVMGIEFAYAAETAFVSPLLLNIGLRHRNLTLMWFMSPLLGFFITPILGSLSDGCRSQLGRRRPFILLLSIGIILGLLLVPNGKQIGIWMGDSYKQESSEPNTNPPYVPLIDQLSVNLIDWNLTKSGKSTGLTHLLPSPELEAELSNDELANSTETLPRKSNVDGTEESEAYSHSWGLFFTVVGTVLLDFDADACQSPSRAFMLDITLPEDHARGLSAFTVMAGLGGSIGYFLGALNWENTFLGEMFGGHVRAVFTLVLFIFVGCVLTTLRSFAEIPIDRLWTSSHNPLAGNYRRFDEDIRNLDTAESSGTTEDETSFTEGEECGKYTMETIAPTAATAEIPTFREYVKTIVKLPKSLQWLCVTNFFSWISLVCYSLYFTDFVGEAVFGGDPAAGIGSPERINYESGVRFGCLGMSLYSLSCAVYSLKIQVLVEKFGSKRVYLCGHLVYGLGMLCMAATRHPAGVLIFSWTAGIMYATLFTMPYLLVARYHAADTFDFLPNENSTAVEQRRGLGTDVAIVSSMVFLAQMTQALTLGSIVAAAGTTTAIVCAASVLAFCGAISSTKVLYLDL